MKIFIAVAVGFILGFGTSYSVNTSEAPSVEQISDGTNKNISEQVTTMKDSMADMTGTLAGKTGSALDRTFIENMIVHHEGAIAMAEVVVGSTKQPELKAMAENIINTQRSEVETMKGWLNKWYGL